MCRVAVGSQLPTEPGDSSSAPFGLRWVEIWSPKEFTFLVCLQTHLMTVILSGYWTVGMAMMGADKEFARVSWILRFWAKSRVQFLRVCCEMTGILLTRIFISLGVIQGKFKGVWWTRHWFRIWPGSWGRCRDQPDIPRVHHGPAAPVTHSRVGSDKPEGFPWMALGSLCWEGSMQSFPPTLIWPFLLLFSAALD